MKREACNRTLEYKFLKHRRRFLLILKTYHYIFDLLVDWLTLDNVWRSYNFKKYLKYADPEIAYAYS